MRHRAASASHRIYNGKPPPRTAYLGPSRIVEQWEFNPRSTEPSKRGIHQLEEADPLTTAITVSVVGKRRRSTLYGDRTTTSAPECIVVGIYYHAPNPSWGRE